MADLIERQWEPSTGRDPRETLEPMLDDLVRGLGYDKAVVLVYDEPSASLRGLFGWNVTDDQARRLSVGVAGSDNPLVVAMRTGAPQRVDPEDGTAVDENTAAALGTMGIGGFVAAPLRSATGRSDGPRAVVLLARKDGVRDADLERLVPFARQASAALTREQDVQLLRRTSESHAIEKEWLWWMVNSVADPVLVTDAQNDILHLNRRAEHLFRSSDEDSAGKRRAVFMNNFLFTAALSGWNLEASSRARNREVTLVDPIEGNELIYEVISMPALNHRIGERGTVSVLKDVTDIRHMTEELTRSAERIQSADIEIRAERDRLDLVLRSVPNPIIVVDNDNRIITLNAAAQRLFAPTREGGRHDQIALANDARFTSFLSQLRLEPAHTKRGEVMLTDPQTDEHLEMEVTAAEVRGPHGAVVAIVSAMQDVGRLRELERRRLEQVLFDTEKLAATGRLAASIAHEINNPLEAVQNALYLLTRAVPEDSSERSYLDIATRETQRMSRILRQMLGFYRPATAMAATDVNALVQEAEALVAKRLREKTVTVTTSLEPDLPAIRASADQLKQVLLNLFLNAAEAMPRGGILYVATQSGGGEYDAQRPDVVRIDVRDTGSGMSEETIARIFEPFFSTKSEKGTGLGLWVSHGIVQAHGGTLKVRSRPGQGTTFTITLPIAGPQDDGEQ
ncbi:MAG TPA: ATP-binding protein [Candidatus Limnocylindria bacterium]|nr:ATP-binding protein [Candidatus Limnocylindria bacterium]